MSCDAQNDSSRLQAISQALNLGSLARYGLIAPWFIRLPPWTLVTYGILALACAMLRETIPQESADRLAWWGYVLRRKRKSRPKRLNRPGSVLRANAPLWDGDGRVGATGQD